MTASLFVVAWAEELSSSQATASHLVRPFTIEYQGLCEQYLGLKTGVFTGAVLDEEDEVLATRDFILPPMCLKHRPIFFIAPIVSSSTEAGEVPIRFCR